jgi:hypothetical protein
MVTKSFFDLFRFDLRDLHHRTELLEAHDWDEEALEETLKIVGDFMNCFFLPPSDKSTFDFDSWIHNSINKEFINLGLSQEQSRIVCHLIINRKEEFLTLVNLEEN